MSSGQVCSFVEAGSSHTLEQQQKQLRCSTSAAEASTGPAAGSHLGSWWQTEPESLLMSAGSPLHLMKVASVSCSVQDKQHFVHTAE